MISEKIRRQILCSYVQGVPEKNSEDIKHTVEKVFFLGHPLDVLFVS